MEVTQKQLAEIFDVHPRTIRRWTRSGMPSLGSGPDRTYRTEDCISWRVETQAENLRQAVRETGDDVPPEKVSSARYEAAKADMKELALAREREDIMTREGFEAVVGALLDRIRQELQRIPGRWGAQAVGIENPRQGEAFLKKVVREVLERLSGPVADDLEGEIPE